MAHVRVVPLCGSNATSLKDYLKTLGVFRIVALQKDREARLWWGVENPYLQSVCDRVLLERFFLYEYRPTPFVAPWNGGSGFFKKGAADAALAKLEEATNPRLSDYVETIRAAKAALECVGVGGSICSSAKAESQRKARAKSLKLEIIRECRARLPEVALPGLDAMAILGHGRVLFAPLLGSGGNDGNLEFTSNFVQRLLDILPISLDTEVPPRSRDWLTEALFGGATVALQKAAVGQFSPGGVGGPNTGQTEDAESLVNPWDYVLLMEGCAVLAGAATRRLRAEALGTGSFPFSVRLSPGGASPVADDEASAGRGELWLPLWERPASWLEVSHLFGEGRAQVGRRSAHRGVDLARAIASLGVSRGIQSFQRFAFLAGQRSGNMHLSVNLGRLPVRVRPEVGLFEEIDGWLSALRRAVGAEAPGSAKRALRRVEDSIVAFCQHGGPRRFQDVVISLGHAERVLSSRHRGTSRDSHLDEVPPLRGPSPRRWVAAADDGSAGFRLAAALASVGDRDIGPVRCQLEPVTWSSRGVIWLDHGSALPGARWARKPVWGSARVARNLQDVLIRRCLEGTMQGLDHLPTDGVVYASLRDINLFLEGRLDEERLAGLLWGMSTFDWVGKEAPPPLSSTPAGPPPPELPRGYALLKLLFLPFDLRRSSDGAPLRAGATRPQVLSMLAAGRVHEAISVAHRRLSVSGFRPMGGRGGSGAPRFIIPREGAVRLSAALLVPISRQQARCLARMVLQCETD